MKSYPRSKNGHYLWTVVWLVSLIFVFEGEVRSIGLLEPVLPINLLPGLWLSDIGLLFPILFSMPFIVLNIFLRIRLVNYLLVSCAYGMVLFFLHNNSFAGLGNDLRTCVAFFTGLSLVYLMPNDYKKILTLMNIISLIIVLIIIFHLLAIPDYNIIDNERITSPSAFTLIGIPLTLIAPIIIISTFSGDRKNITISWVTFLLLVTLSVLIMKTRSLLIAEMVAFLTVIFAIAYSASFLKHKKDSKNIIMHFEILLILISVVVTTILISQAENFNLFKERFVNFEDDVNFIWRQIEVLAVYQTMSLRDLIFGMGFNPPSPLFAADKGESYNALHIGILNMWWRFGFIVFMAWMILYIRLVINWINSLRSLKNNAYGIRIDQRKIAIIMCAPGVFTIVSLSFLSGGWSLHAFLPLGILLGMHDAIIHEIKHYPV